VEKIFHRKTQRTQSDAFFSFAFDLPSSCKDEDYGKAGRLRLSGMQAKANEKQSGCGVLYLSS
jgi:hypothetical protein